VIGVSKESHRWGTVVTKWRKNLFKQHNVVMGPTYEHSYLVLNSERRVGYSVNKYNQGRRTVRRSAEVAESTNRKGLPPEMLHTLDHVVFVYSMFRQHSLTAARKLGKVEALAG